MHEFIRFQVIRSICKNQFAFVYISSEQSGIETSRAMLYVIALRAQKHLRMVRDEYLGRDKEDKRCVR